MRFVVPLTSVLLAIACSKDTEGLSDASAHDASPRDASVGADAVQQDSMTSADAETRDGAMNMDATPGDAEENDAGMSATRGTCTSPADCPAGLECVAIPDDPDGWHTCLDFPRVDVKFCNPDVFGCCNSSECTEGQNAHCVPGPLWLCGGPPPLDQNVCTYDECASAADCTAQTMGVCVPWRAFNEAGSRCTYGDCIYDRDCTSRTGGLCLPFFDPCAHRFLAFFCTYDDSPCRSDADCAATPQGYCAPGDDGMTSCQQFIPPP